MKRARTLSRTSFLLKIRGSIFSSLLEGFRVETESIVVIKGRWSDWREWLKMGFGSEVSHLNGELYF